MGVGFGSWGLGSSWQAPESTSLDAEPTSGKANALRGLSRDSRPLWLRGARVSV